ncbi:MAG: undecaprenyl/decaprenyl-phosphate alpha-N-acetylglucosaminyl 1-phosphate transferase [Planctomycetota bacterium]|nr:MAG: undecaprenyl/decaprenyl-phosphate alpha-N-acetylglucosaminyl 1-phosphate transferase [Planctomycetota bacterium]RLS92322.1 MAG: undecaprenyl/decaprenyl-phosphate alpha-N-acetylglucosaminyl 1-phosphate transferase [Planctomycetota bacterium]
MMVSLVLALIAVGFALSLPFSWFLVHLGNRVGALDSAGAAGHIKELRKVPNIGGISIFWSVVAPLSVGFALIEWMPERVTEWVPSIRAFLPRLEATQHSWAWILIGALAMHLLGLYDDRRALRAWPKLFLQVAVAASVVWWGDVRLLSFLSEYGELGTMLSLIVSVLWIIVIVNAVNFLDNMDGLAGGITAIAATCFMVATILNGQYFIAGALALLVGSLVGFLAFNVPPARLFMGDGGSLFIGFWLAALAARTTFVSPERADYALGTAWYGVFMPIIVLAIPLYDGVFVTVYRLSKGKSPFVGGPEHISHRLVQLGLSKRRAVAVLWLLTAITGISGIGLGRMEPWQAALIGVQLFAIFLAMAILETSVSRTNGNGHGGSAS